MVKVVAVIPVLLAASLAANPEDIESHLVENETPLHFRRILTPPPYAYKDTEKRSVAVQPVTERRYHSTQTRTMPFDFGFSTISITGIISWAYTIVKSLVKGVIRSVVYGIKDLIVKVFKGLGICYLFPILCPVSTRTRIELTPVEDDYQTLSTSKTLTEAAQFLQEALRKYNSKHNNT